MHYDHLEPADIDLLDQVAAVSAAGGPVHQATEAYLSDPRLPIPTPLASFSD